MIKKPDTPQEQDPSFELALQVQEALDKADESVLRTDLLILPAEFKDLGRAQLDALTYGLPHTFAEIPAVLALPLRPSLQGRQVEPLHQKLQDLQVAFGSVPKDESSQPPGYREPFRYHSLDAIHDFLREKTPELGLLFWPEFKTSRIEPFGKMMMFVTEVTVRFRDLASGEEFVLRSEGAHSDTTAKGLGGSQTSGERQLLTKFLLGTDVSDAQDPEKTHNEVKPEEQGKKPPDEELIELQDRVRAIAKAAGIDPITLGSLKRHFNLKNVEQLDNKAKLREIIEDAEIKAALPPEDSDV